METKYRVKNFRVFDEKGGIINFSPITILTGCNSSGKSSLVKSLFMLDDFLKNVKNDMDSNKYVDLEKYKIDFSHEGLALLGNFDNVIHKGSENKEITMIYETYSAYLVEQVTVELVFSSNKDSLHNGHLNKISVWRKNGTLIY